MAAKEVADNATITLPCMQPSNNRFKKDIKTNVTKLLVSRENR